MNSPVVGPAPFEQPAAPAGGFEPAPGQASSAQPAAQMQRASVAWGEPPRVAPPVVAEADERAGYIIQSLPVKAAGVGAGLGLVGLPAVALATKAGLGFAAFALVAGPVGGAVVGFLAGALAHYIKDTIR